MPAIISSKAPAAALERLSQVTGTILFDSEGIVYDAISCHPDIFFCQAGDTLIYASQTPQKYIDRLSSSGVKLVEGHSILGQKYPSTASFNAVCTDDSMIHNLRLTDRSILSLTASLDHIHVEQGYCRCNLLSVGKGCFITSDRGIQTKLQEEGFTVLFAGPEGILLPGFKHGFFGGACGIRDNTVYFTGSLHHYPEGKKVREFLSSNGFEITELYDGPLFDGGGILFV